MEEGCWLSVEEDDSRNSSIADSDLIDSETEAELYSVIHHEQNLKCHPTETKDVQISDGMKNESFIGTNEEFLRTESVCNINKISKSGDNNTIKKFTCETLFQNKVAKKLNLVKEKISGSIDECNITYSQNTEDGVIQNDKDALLKKECKRKTDYSPCKNSNSSLVKKKCTSLNDSSDSDSDIWTEVDAADEKEFKTNMLQDVICLSSNSESESEFQFNSLSLPKRNERNLNNLSMPNIKIGENIKDLWFINDEDIRRPKKSNSRRYHDHVEITCTNCFGKGHNSRVCPLPRSMKCFICGGGGHQGSVCINRICGKCFGIGHDTKNCWMPCMSYCKLCSMRGHIKENCPDIWRRYHLTTHPGKIVRAKRIKNSTLSYCWNCGQTGHFGAVCKESRSLKHCLPTWPCVVSYDDPEDLLKRRLKGLDCTRHFNFKKNALFNQFNQRKLAVGVNFNAAKKNKKKKKKLNQLCNNVKKAPREKDFPRTPKNNNQSNLSDDTVPESVKQMLIKKQKRKEKNRKRRLKRRLEFVFKINASGNSLQTGT